MKKKNWATRMISGLLSAMMVLTTVVTPMTVMASEIIPEDELREYVSSLPELKDVKDQLDPDEIVEAKDYEVDFGTEIDLRNDFTNMEIPNRDKVKVSFFEAKNAAGTDYSANNADTYKAVYYVEPMNEMHPVYRVSRSITVKEPVTEPQVPEEGSDGGDDGQSGEEAEDAEADPVPESEAAMIPEPEAAESYVPDTFEDSEESSVFYEFTEEAFQEEMAAVTETVDEAGTAETIMAAESEAAFAEEEMMEEMAAETFEVSEEEAAESITENDDAGDEEDPPAAEESISTEASAMEESVPAEPSVTEDSTHEEPAAPEESTSQETVQEEPGTAAQEATDAPESETAAAETESGPEVVEVTPEEMDAMLEEAETQDTYDEESGWTVSGVIQWATEEEEIDLAALGFGETVSFEVPRLRGAKASSTQTVEVTCGTCYQYSDYDLGSYQTHKYTVKFGSVSATAYCVQPSRGVPGDGTFTITKLKDGKALAKVCYYGTKAAGDEGFFAEKYPDFSAGKRFIITHMAAAYANGSSDAFSGTNDTGKKLAMELYNYCQDMPSIPDVDMEFSDDNVQAYVDGNSQRTKVITFDADELQTITFKLPDGVKLHNETTGKTSKAGAEVEICGGTKFYFSAPLTQAQDVGVTWYSKMKGSVTKDYSAYKITTGSDTQDLALVFGEAVGSDEKYVEMTVTWVQKAKLTVVKTDAAGKRKLSGAVFGVYSDKDCTSLIVKMPATDANGSSTVELDANGTVYLKELTPPKRYRAKITSEGVTVEAGKTTTKTIPNDEILGTLKVYKEGQVLTGATSDSNGTTFKYETAKLAGAKYSVTAGADITAPDGTVVYKKGAAVASLTTDKNGEAVLNNLTLGTYVITETGAPANYVNKGESKTVTLSEGSNSAEAVVGTATFSNDRQKVEVTAVKQDKLTQTVIAGAVYGLYADAEIKNNAGTVIVKKDVLIGKVTTGSDGKGKFSADLPLGCKFYVKELSAPTGYKLNGSDTYRFTTTYTYDKEAKITFSHTFENEEIRGKLTIYKEGEVLVGADVTDAGTTFKYEVRKQKGATFAVYAGAEIKSAGGKVIYKKGDLVKDGLVTGDDGSVSLDNLYLGTYTVKETGAPKNFVLNGESKDITLSLANLSGEVVLGSITIKNNRQKAKVTVVKQDDTTKNPLSGGIYGLYAGADIKAVDGKVAVKKDTFIEKVTTGTDGSAVFKSDLPLGGSYYVKEMQAPKNYYRNQKDTFPFTFSYTDEKQAEVAFSHTFLNERVNARIDLIKVDAETGEPQGDAKLGKASYGLYARENIVHPDGKTGVLYKAGAQVATLTTDDEGKAFIEDLYLGKYYIKELVPSEGYLLDTKEYDLDCAYEGDQVKTVKKTATSKEQVIKQPFQVIKAANNGQTDADLLKGVGFSAYLISSLTKKKDGSYDFSKAKPIVLTADGKTEMFTDAKGHAVSIPIPYGKYIVRETTTPHNFTPVDDFEVTISENHPNEPQQWRVLLDDEFEAKLKIVKKDDETKKPVLLAKTEFKVYDLDNKQYVEQVTTYPSVVTHKSYFTDENGYLILPNNLKIGHYRIEEVTAPYGYVLNHNAFEVLVDSNTAYQMDGTSGDAVIEVAMENQPVKGKLTIKKSGEVLSSYDKDFGYEMTYLADAEFAVYADEDIYTPDHQRDADGNRITVYAKDTLVATVTTDASGTAVVEDLPLGTYRVEETKAPFGFALNTEPQTVTFAYADQETPVVEQTAEFVNDRQKVEISVEKQDAETGKKLEGAVFGLYAKSAIASADHGKVLVEADTLIEEMTSGADGKAVFTKDLPLGQYYVKEHKAPDGYVSSDEILDFDAAYQGQDVPVVKLLSVKKNEPTTFEFTKSDITTGTELEGAVLTILTRKGDVIERWTSVKNEPHVVKCLTAGESYVLREEFAPYGYIRATDVVFTVKDTAEIQKVEMKDEVPTALLIINKKGEFLDKVSLLDNAKGTVEHFFEYVSGNLSPVTFEVYAAEDIKAADDTQPDYYKKDDLVGTITTDDTGIAKLGDLPVGKYYVVEKETAYGYVLDNAPRYVDLSYRDQDTPIVVYDEKWQNARQKVSLHLVKKEKETESPLKGAIFGLYTAEDIKSKEGKTLIEKDTLIEQKPTDVNGEIAFIADLPIDGKYYVTEIFAPNGYVNAQEKQEFTFTYEGSDKDILSYSFMFVNEPTTVELSKTDITTGKELPGAHLRVIDGNANLIDEWVSEEKPHIIQKLVVGREYELIETIPADGYATAESVAFKVENTGEVQKVKMEDDVTKVCISKSDITTGGEIPGAKLSIIDEAGKVVETWTSGEEPHYVEKLPVGKYTLCEETAPAGYLVTEDVLFTVKDTGVEQKVEMKDDFTKVEITKSDITSGKPVIGAKLVILDKDGKEVESWVTEEKPHYIEKLPVGEYTLREITAPDGYLREEDVKFTVKETGEIQKVVMKDDYTKVEISKQDITNSKELPGAKLTIFDKDGKEVESWVSEEKPHYIEKLPLGEYTLREVTAPDGYEVAEDVKFTVAETGEIQHVVMKDAPKAPDTPDTPDTPQNTPQKTPDKPDTPKTGDESRPLLWASLMALALFGLIGSLVVMKKNKKNR